MRDRLNLNGWACVVFCAILVSVTLLFSTHLTDSLGNIDTSSPGSGIGGVVTALVGLVIGVFVLAGIADLSMRLVKRGYRHIPNSVQPYGWIGFFLFPIPFVLLWWIFLKTG